MARERKPPSPPPGVPAWFMTYSDVVTLLMTFFILLLTFASSEPERFVQMRAVAFGGGSSATGLIGNNATGTERDALAIRMRPSGARVGAVGSETPPVHSDPVRETLAEGLSELEQQHPLANRQSFQFEMEWSALFDSNGEPSAFAAERFRLLAAQLRRLPLDVQLQAPSIAELSDATRLADRISRQAGIPAGRLSVGVRPQGDRAARVLRITVARSDVATVADQPSRLRP